MARNKFKDLRDRFRRWKENLKGNRKGYQDLRVDLEEMNSDFQKWSAKDTGGKQEDVDEFVIDLEEAEELVDTSDEFSEEEKKTLRTILRNFKESIKKWWAGVKERRGERERGGFFSKTEKVEPSFVDQLLSLTNKHQAKGSDTTNLTEKINDLINNTHDVDQLKLGKVNLESMLEAREKMVEGGKMDQKEVDSFKSTTETINDMIDNRISGLEEGLDI